MTDSSGYINAYIDTTMGMLHENLSTILQLKTQARLSTELVKAKGEEFSKLQEELEKTKSELDSSRADLQSKLDSTRSDLQSELDSTRNELEKTKTIDNEQINDARADAKRWEEECNVLRNKVSVVDTLTNQFNDIKQQYKRATEELNSIKEENTKLQTIVAELEEVKKLLSEKEKQVEYYENQNDKKSSLSAPKKNINTKNIVPPVMEPEEKADDF